MKNQNHQIPIVALCGFLGSGKTTLLRRWSRDSTFADAAMIVHDLSDFGLDAELLSDEESKPKPGQLKNRVAALHGEHAREKLHSSVKTALTEISDLAPPLVLCESTGAARPWPLIKALTQNNKFYLRHFIVTVDALNLHRDFNDGLTLTGEADAIPDTALNYAAEILTEQMAFASVIILTKVDTLPKQVIDQQVQNLKKLQPRVAIGLSAQAGLLLSHLDTIPAPKLLSLADRAKKLQLEQQNSTADEVGSLILRDPRPFHPERLHDACMNHLSTGLYRTKGFLWIASRSQDVLLWQQSGSQIALELTGTWRAEVVKNKDDKLLPEEVELLKTQLKKEHPTFGDRFNEITLIGLNTARNAFYEALQHALCTDEEIEAWKNGDMFTDPWPQSVKIIT